MVFVDFLLACHSLNHSDVVLLCHIVVHPFHEVCPAVIVQFTEHFGKLRVVAVDVGLCHILEDVFYLVVSALLLNSFVASCCHCRMGFNWLFSFQSDTIQRKVPTIRRMVRIIATQERMMEITVSMTAAIRLHTRFISQSSKRRGIRATTIAVDIAICLILRLGLVCI